MISVAASVADEVSLTGRIGYQHYPECRIICTYPYTLKQGVWVVCSFSLQNLCEASLKYIKWIKQIC